MRDFSQPGNPKFVLNNGLPLIYKAFENILNFSYYFI